MKLKIGKNYKRRQLHSKFGGQQQGGISTPSGSDMILLFSSAAGESYGYDDGWTSANRFRYTGEGQVGDMEFVRGNLKIRDHEKDGRRLMLFIYERKGLVKYEGEFRYINHEIFRTPDRNGDSRDGIRFILERSGSGGARSMEGPEDEEANPEVPNRTERSGLVTSRVGQGKFRQKLIDKFRGRCAVTGSGLSEVLVASHIVPWRDSTNAERMDPYNGILLSPNYDALFDRHLISFDEQGRIRLSRLLKKDDLNALGIDPKAKIEVTGKMSDYLSRHLSQLR